jgi:hypothetical protein
MQGLLKPTEFQPEENLSKHGERNGAWQSVAMNVKSSFSFDVKVSTWIWRIRAGLVPGDAP